MRKIFLLGFLLFSSSLFAQTELPSFFNDNMVLQRNETVAIWGHDKPNVQIKVAGSWGNSASIKSDEKGGWKLKLQTPEAGGPHKLIINGSDEIVFSNVLIGEVWLCSGQSNMDMPLKGYGNNSSINGGNEAILNSTNNQIRFFDTERKVSLEPLDNVTGQWQAAAPATVGDFSATAYFFGVKLNRILNVPIGLIHSSWGGSNVEAWTDKQTLLAFKEIKMPDHIPQVSKDKKPAFQTPTLLFNGMIKPFIPFSIKGVIWYQGESNVFTSETYKERFTAMIQSWRTLWKQENMPFYFVQIAPWDYTEYGKFNSAFLREAQVQTLQTVDNVGMAITMDIGDCVDIHPAEKKLVGDRLAYWALAKSYGIEGFAFSGPIYKSMSITDKKIKLDFEYSANGLSSSKEIIAGFAIAGADKVFHAAIAKINKDKTVMVWSDKVQKPVHVRYAFDNCTEGSLINTEGLPASSFRTDNWKE